MTRNPHGGARPGAGRKPQLKGGQRVTVMLDRDSIKTLDTYRKRTECSNRSEALRLLLGVVAHTL